MLSAAIVLMTVNSLCITQWLLCVFHWLLGGGRKISVQEQIQFDITKELSNMKPLRKVSKQQLDIGMHQPTLIM